MTFVRPGQYPKAEDAQGRLMATCWCEREMVLVASADLRRGVTRPCGHPECLRLDRDRR